MFDVRKGRRGLQHVFCMCVIQTSTHPQRRAQPLQKSLYVCDACTLRAMHIILHTPPRGIGVAVAVAAAAAAGGEE